MLEILGQLDGPGNSSYQWLRKRGQVRRNPFWIPIAVNLLIFLAFRRIRQFASECAARCVLTAALNTSKTKTELGTETPIRSCVRSVRYTNSLASAKDRAARVPFQNIASVRFPPLNAARDPSMPLRHSSKVYREPLALHH